MFGNDGKAGREHEAIARQRLLAWLGQRWRYGFIEWYSNSYRMFSNEFLHDLSIVDIGLLRETGLLPLVSRVLRPVSDGVAIQRANTYTCRTPCFQLATAQRYHPGGYGDQQHIWSATLSPAVSIFTTHPAGPRSARGVLGNSPGHWVGNGRNPDAAQHRNVVLAIYDVPDRKGFMEETLLKQTHAYFPRQLFTRLTA